MQKPQFRNFLALCSAKIVDSCQLTVDKLSLCRKLSTINSQLSIKLCVIFFLIVSSISKTDAQVGKGAGNANFLDFNVKSYYFGITLGSNNSDYLVHRSKDFLPGANDSIAGVTSVQGPGLNLAIVSNLKLGDYFDIRFLPGFSFAERDVNYSAVRRGATIPSQKIESVFVELPFHVRYKSAPYNDKRFFVTTGLKYSYDIQSKNRDKIIINSLKVSPTDFQFEVGAGIQMFFPFFIFSPEIKFSQGLGNILIYQEGVPQSGILESLISRTFTISLHFEG